MAHEGDEADQLDLALDERYRADIAAKRRALVQTLDTLQMQSAGDSWIFGQRLRFRVDQGEFTAAIALARSCAIDRSWCAAMVGFVYHAAHDLRASDSAFAVATSALPLELRCGWTDIRFLLPDSVRAAYTSQTCAARDSLAAHYWWLATPLFSEDFNRRRAEHYARRVLTLLHGALDQDKLHFLDPARGGGAVVAMLVRYGWPTTARTRNSANHEHNGYLTANATRPVAPYSTAEYSGGRTQFTATWQAIAQPFDAGANDWQLAAPPGLQTNSDDGGDVSWPIEHMRLRDGGKVAQLPDGQLAVFRRPQALRLTYAVSLDFPMASARTSDDEDRVPPLPAALTRALAAPGTTATLLASDAPEAVEVIAQRTAAVESRLALSGTMRPRPVLLAVEAVAAPTPGSGPGVDDAVLAARTRFGLRPPPALDALRSGEVAVSDPAFFAPGDGSLPADVDALLPRMLGTTTVARGGKVGVFWEHYGVNPRDSVGLAVDVRRVDDPSLLKRVGAALRLTAPPIVGVSIAWTALPAPASTSSATTTPPAASVPIAARSVVLDLAPLPRGTYAIEVAVTAPRHQPVRAHRILEIR